jgi:hypothetical protein
MSLICRSTSVSGRFGLIVPLGCMGLAESGIMSAMKYWEIIADKLVLLVGRGAIVAPGQKMAGGWIVDAHREGRRYIVHSDELLSAFLELEKTLL